MNVIKASKNADKYCNADALSFIDKTVSQMEQLLGCTNEANYGKERDEFHVAPFNIEESFNDEISHNEGSVIEISCNERSVIEI